MERGKGPTKRKWRKSGTCYPPWTSWGFIYLFILFVPTIFFFGFRLFRHTHTHTHTKTWQGEKICWNGGKHTHTHVYTGTDKGTGGCDCRCRRRLFFVSMESKDSCPHSLHARTHTRTHIRSDTHTKRGK